MNVPFIYAFQSEWLKKKRSLASRMIIIGAFFTPLVIIIARLLRFDRLAAIYSDGAFWEKLWTSSWESMAVFLLPLGAVLFTALATQLEFKNNAWKQVHTLPLRFYVIYFTKLSVIVVMVLQFLFLFTIGVLLSGLLPGWIAGVKIPSLSAALLGHFLTEDLAYFVCILPVIALQYTIGLFNRNFLVPVGLGFICWIGALSMLPWRYNIVFPYTYVILRYLHGAGKSSLTIAIGTLQGISLVWFSLITLFGYGLYMSKKEKG